ANPGAAAPEPAPPDTAEGGAGTQDVAAPPLPVAGEATARACDEGSEAGRETAQARHKRPPLSPVRRHGGAIPI
ncbi:hypothetical protein, partial [Methylobacterium nigriterrae]|uniref:hypothetical protein n=1 Tax=Methylobacterium nigriterrae TaxID=3127512 RepID=UPI003013D43E